MSSFARHRVARDWLDQQLNGFRPCRSAVASMLAFLRLVTNPRYLNILNRLAMRGSKYIHGLPLGAGLPKTGLNLHSRSTTWLISS